MACIATAKQGDGQGILATIRQLGRCDVEEEMFLQRVREMPAKEAAQWQWRVRLSVEERMAALGELLLGGSGIDPAKGPLEALATICALGSERVVQMWGEMVALVSPPSEGDEDGVEGEEEGDEDDEVDDDQPAPTTPMQMPMPSPMPVPMAPKKPKSKRGLEDEQQINNDNQDSLYIPSGKRRRSADASNIFASDMTGAFPFGTGERSFQPQQQQRRAT